MDDDLGLRERKKRETRAALIRTALELCAERGVDEVTVADIAAGANVSTRTFFNYFSSKEEALVGGTERAERFLELLTARPDDEPVWDAVRAAVHGLVADDGPLQREFVAQTRLVSMSPSLALQQMANYLEMEQLLVAEVARRAGARETDMLPRLIVAAVASAVRVAIDHFIDTPTDAALTDLIDEGLLAFSTGLHGAREVLSSSA
jgi:AcrR family transcriptional regulator